MTGESFIGINVSPQVRYIVTMPRNAAIVARSGDGSIRIERISGKVELRTDDGSIRGDDVAGELTLTTGDGSVVLDDVNGSIRGQHERRWRERDGQAGERPRPHGGRIRHGACRAGQRDVGRLVAHHGRRRDRALSSRRLQRGYRRAHGGRLDPVSEFNLTEDRDGERENRTVRGRIGKGGHTLKVRTGDGSIALRAGV